MGRQALGLQPERGLIKRLGKIETPSIASRFGEGLQDLCRRSSPVNERCELQRGLILFSPSEDEQVIINVAPVRRVLRAQPFEDPQRGTKITAPRYLDGFSVQARGLGRSQFFHCLGRRGEHQSAK